MSVNEIMKLVEAAIARPMALRDAKEFLEELDNEICDRLGAIKDDIRREERAP